MSRSTRYHHVAFGTKDIELTYDFYVNRLGLRLSHCENHVSGKGWMKHFFFDVGNGEQLAFFAFANIGEKPEYRTDISTGLGLPTWVNHVALNVESMAEIEAMKRRAAEHDVKLHMESDHGWCHSIYFLDPNGILIEFTTTTDPKGFEQTPEEALAALRQTPATSGEAGPKNGATRVTP